MINLLSLAAAILTMLRGYLVAQGKLRSVYVLGIVNGFVYVLLHGALALADPMQTGVCLLVIPAVWSIAMGIMGLKRVSRVENK